MSETDEIVRLRAQLDGQANTMKKHRATWMAILKDRRGWREAARVERERHLVWEQRFEEERQRASAWKACAVALYESSEATHITQDAGIDAAWQRYRDARQLFTDLKANT